MKTRIGKAIVLWSLGLLILFVQSNVTPIAAQGSGIQGPFSSPPIRAASFDGDVRRLPQAIPSGTRNVFKLGMLPRKALTPASPDPVRQTRQGPTAMPAPTQNFKGLDLASWGSGYPPDTNGDVALNHYIQTVNTATGMFNKTGTQLAAFKYNSFFGGTGITGTPCDSNNFGDPVVLYDAMADRWVITDFAFGFVGGIPIPPHYECIAVSKTSDPVGGGWWLYAFLAHNTWLNDYPKWGVWPDAYYMSANMFDSLDNFRGVESGHSIALQ